MKLSLSKRRATAASGQGFIFATTGTDYTDLARRTARTLRLAMPDAQIDLFTDQEIEDTVFDKIHPIREGGPRPKMQALQSSRFKKTIYLDADIVVLEDLSDVFELLEITPIAAALGVSRNRVEMKSYLQTIPHCFPVFNSGVLAVRKCAETEALIEDWDKNYRASTLLKDQPVLRGTLYQRKLTPMVLPPEYNLLKMSMLKTWGSKSGGVRCLHVRALHDVSNAMTDEPVSLHEVVDDEVFQNLVAARQGDHSLTGESPVYSLPAIRPLVKPDRKKRKQHKRDLLGAGAGSATKAMPEQ
ncbi:hypothetical protein K3555_21155 (plasmid) [Leisingera sp. M527]|uniref:putative nucleotide-diphospho-sugar transferase n=1 Tax=Leisingera sp. M527 TaxID=2867014 RepID=UPI0021A28C15|nr:putative nucleotide-diphospho-sugar transferase [Leisingera sp. M527]UWQ35171.1 hypothetical protein K3555_21155 [Leisingera sp. M527]